MVNIGGLLADDNGLPSAHEWFQRAIDGGTEAMADNGALLEDAYPAVALDWYHRAADAGDTRGMVKLAALLEERLVRRQDMAGGSGQCG